MLGIALDRQVRIGLLWHSPASRNLGVGALTIANIAIVREVAESLGLVPAFTIIGMREEGERYVSAQEASEYELNFKRLVDPRGYAAICAAQDIIIDIGAGDSFADLYGLKRFAFLWLTKMIAAWQGKPPVLAPQTIGPFSKEPYRTLASWALKRARVVVTRDRMSADACREISPKAKVILSADVAFALPYVDGCAARGGPRTRVGVNVSGLLFNEAEAGSNRFGMSIDYAKVMRAFISAMTLRNDVELYLVSHATHATDTWDDDGRVADRLAAEFPAAIRAPNFIGPSEAKSFISSLDFLVAGRMHACIGALSAGTPVVPVAYSRKFAGLFGLLEYDFMLPVTGYGDVDALNYLLSCFEERAQIQEAALASMTRVDGLIGNYKEVLVQTLKDFERK